jgi:hypothetical protein
MPAGFVGDAGLSVRLRYTTSPATWNWLNYYANNADSRYLKLAGGTLTGALTLAANPSTALQPATKQYTDAADATLTTAAATAQTTANTGVTNAAAAQSTANTGVTNAAAAQTTANAAVVRAGDTMTGALGITAGTAAAPSLFVSGSTNTGLYSPGSGQVAISTNSSQRLTVDANGRLLIGTLSAFDTYNAATNYLLGIEKAAGYTVLALKTNANDATGAYICLSKSRSTTANGKTIVQNNDTLGEISFEGSDGSSILSGAYVTAKVDGTPSVNSMPSRLVFSTTSAGTGSPTERLRITSAGLVGVGTSVPAPYTSGAIPVHIHGGANPSELRLTTDGSGQASATDGAILQLSGTTLALWNAENDAIRFGTNNVERVRISSTGAVGIGTSSFSAVSGISGAKLQVVGGTIIGVDGLSTGGSGWLAFDSACTAPTSTKPVIYHKAGTGLGFRSDYEMSFEIGASEAIRIDNQRRVGIGTASPGSLNSTGNQLVVGSGTGNQGLTIFAGSSSDSNIYFADGTAGTAPNIGYIQYRHASDRFDFGTNDTTRMSIDSSGRLLVGTSSTSKQTRALFQGNSGGGATAEVFLAADTSNPGGGMGNIYFSDNSHNAAAIIAGVRDGGTWTSGSSQPISLQFYTTANGAASPTERFRISSTGAQSSVIPGGSTLYPHFGCRAWVNFNGTGTVAIRGSGNVSSITDNGAGDYTVNFTTAMVDADYCVSSCYRNNVSGYNRMAPLSIKYNVAPTASALRVEGGYGDDNSGLYNNQDLDYCCISIFR